jgi:hypothetical protein
MRSYLELLHEGTPLPPYLDSRWYMRTASGRKTMVMRIGYTAAVSMAFCSIQLPPVRTGSTKSSRMALAVDDTGVPHRDRA